MEIKYINSLGNKTKIQGIPGGEEKQKEGKAGRRGEEKQDVFQSICFLLIIRLPQNPQNHWGFVSFESEKSGEKWMLIRQ